MGPRGSRLIGPLESLEGPYCCHGQSQADPSICGMPSLRLRLGPAGEGGGVNVVVVGGCVSSTELRRLLCLFASGGGPVYAQTGQRRSAGALWEVPQVC
jgi:hypothetical protein